MAIRGQSRCGRERTRGSVGAGGSCRSMDDVHAHTVELRLVEDEGEPEDARTASSIDEGRKAAESMPVASSDSICC